MEYAYLRLNTHMLVSFDKRTQPLNVNDYKAFIKIKNERQCVFYDFSINTNTLTYLLQPDRLRNFYLQNSFNCSLDYQSLHFDNTQLSFFNTKKRQKLYDHEKDLQTFSNTLIYTSNHYW